MSHSHGDFAATTDQLKALADGPMKGALHDAQDAADRMKRLVSGIDPSALSTIPSCEQFMNVLSAAVDTYAAAVAAIRHDVHHFRESLAQTAQTMDANDENSAALITAVAHRLNHPLAVSTAGQRAYDKHSVLHHGDAHDAPKVTTPDALPDGSDGQGAGPTDPSTSAPTPPSGSTTYDPRTGNPVPSSSAPSSSAPSSSAPSSSAPSSSTAATAPPTTSATAPSSSPTPSASPTPTPTPAPSGS